MDQINSMSSSAHRVNHWILGTRTVHQEMQLEVGSWETPDYKEEPVAVQMGKVSATITRVSKEIGF